jgi:hypothetical protein
MVGHKDLHSLQGQPGGHLTPLTRKCSGKSCTESNSRKASYQIPCWLDCIERMRGDFSRGLQRRRGQVVRTVGHLASPPGWLGL